MARYFQKRFHQSCGKNNRRTSPASPLRKNHHKSNTNRNNRKGLSLDPHRNHHHHHQQLQTHREDEEEQEEEEEEEELEHGFHQNLQQQQQYGREQQISEEPINSQNHPPKKISYFPFSTASGSTSTFPNSSSEHARFGEKMGENHNRCSTSRLGLVRDGGGGGGGGGEIIQVQGGHIVRSTGRKDRHSKVCTAKGPRDRRVRLSAHTAIQFYDVQDRLGYDRPSKAVDWLIDKAKSAIDELAELPPWHPTATMPAPNTLNPEQNQQMEEDEEENQNEQGFPVQTAGGYMFLQNQQQQQQSNSFLPPSLDSDSIADTIKSFFPMTTSSSSIHFQDYTSPPDLLSGSTNTQTQDLRLSLQSFQDPIFHHSQQHQQHHHSDPSSEQQHALFSTAFDGGGGGSTNAWSEQQMQEMGRFQRMIAWNPNTDSSGGGNGGGGGSGGGGGFMFNSLPQQPPSSSQQALFSNSPNPFFSSQRGPLQSSNSPLSIRAWNNTTDPSMVSDDNQHYQNINPSIHHHRQQQPFASGGFGFGIPARIQGEEEQHGVGASHKPPSSASRRH